MKGKDFPKTDLIDTLVVFSNTNIEGNEEYRRFKHHKTRNCDFRLLNVIFYDNFVEVFQQTGAIKFREVFDAQNGAFKITFGIGLVKLTTTRSIVGLIKLCSIPLKIPHLL
jgi:hypothetical protein